MKWSASLLSEKPGYREVIRFLWLPLRLDCQWRWLCLTPIVQKSSWGGWEECVLYWSDEHWGGR